MSMLFQNYALFDSMTVADNVGFGLVENTKMSRGEIEPLVTELLAFKATRTALRHAGLPRFVARQLATGAFASSY